MKANSSNDSMIHGNLYAQFANSTVSLLAPERKVKAKLIASKQGARMSALDQRQYLMPYEMTSRLIDEMMNLRLKQTGSVSSQTKVEQISTSTPKDRFSALEYTLWRVKYYEDIYARKAARDLSTQNFAFFTAKKKEVTRHGSRNSRRQEERLRGI